LVILFFYFLYTAPSNCAFILIKFEPKVEILPWLEIYILFVFSKSKLTIFKKFEFKKEINWSNREALNEKEWIITHSFLKDLEEIKNVTQKSLTRLENSITSSLESKFLEK